MRPLLTVLVAFALMAGCSKWSKPEIIAASPTAVTIKTSSLSDPIDAAEAHCQQYGKKAVSRGGVKLGVPAYATLYGYDCVKP